MKRTAAKIAFIAAFFVASIGLIIIIRELWLPGLWIGGVGAVFGTLIVTKIPKIFDRIWDRIWPKSMKGWSK